MRQRRLSSPLGEAWWGCCLALLLLTGCPAKPEPPPPPPPPPLSFTSTIEGPAPPAPKAFFDWRTAGGNDAAPDWFADPYAPSTTVAWVDTSGSAGGRLPPHGEAPDPLPPGFGTVHLTRARADLMRDEALIDGAALPRVRIGRDGSTVHLVVHQGVVGGRVVVYLRREGEATSLSVLGRSPSSTPADLRLVADDQPRVAWLDGTHVRLARPTEPGGLTPPLKSPAGLTALMARDADVLALAPVPPSAASRFSRALPENAVGVFRLKSGDPELLGALPHFARRFVGRPEAPLVCGEAGCFRVPGL